MNQNTFVVGLINFKEKVFKWYEKGEKVIRPVFKGLVAFLVLFMTFRMFPYRPVGHLYVVLAVLTLISAFLPFALLYYIASGIILYNLWAVSFDIFAAFAIFWVVCAVGYFRIDGQYSYLAAIVPVLFFCNLGIAVPAVLAVAIGMEALFPAAVGVIVYYFSLSIKDASLVLGGSESSGMGIGLAHVAKSISGNKLFLVMIISVCATIMITSLLRRAFYERAWLVAGTLGNTAMAFLVFVGCVYCDLEVTVWLVIVEIVAGMILCMVVEFFRGIGDVSRAEKTVFEDEEYIYYVKAVPKLKVSQPEPSVINMNETLYEEELEEEPVEEPEEEPEEESSVPSETEEADAEPAGPPEAEVQAEPAGPPEEKLIEEAEPEAADAEPDPEEEASGEEIERSKAE
ncbi:MAG: hypothetical protein IKX76_02070 [Eubacterium sp.]|nr:hypothetical protein [Eubacterium sp.]